MVVNADANSEAAILSADEDAITDKVWDELTSGHTTVGTSGKVVSDLGARLPASGTLAVAGDEMSMTEAMEAELVSSVWDKATASHTTAGTTGKALGDLSARLPGAGTIAVAGDEMSMTEAMEAELVDSVWDEATSGHTTAGTYGKVLVDAATLSATAANHSQTNAGGTTEQTVVDNTTLKGQLQVYLDLTNLTQDATIKIYRKIDNTTYRLIRSDAFSAASAVKGYYSDMFLSRNGIKVTLTSGVAEAADRTVPYEILTDVRA